MAYEVVVHDVARNALFNAVEYLNLISGGPAAAERLVATFFKRIDEIADNPDLYGLSRVDGLAEAGYHAAHVANYIMLYYLSGWDVHVAYFFHQSQDYARYVV